MKINKHDETCFISLSENELSIQKIEEIFSLLEAELNNCHKLELNLEHISDCDTSGVQLLLSLQKYAKENEKTLNINFNSKVKELIDFYNLQNYFV